MKRRGISLGRYYGIEVNLDYSWFILFFLVGWSFAAWTLPVLFPDLALAETLIYALISTALLFLSVLIHEFAHSLYAKKTGLMINRITLFVFGGAAELQEEPKSPRQEFIMAAVGPLASVVLSVLFGIIGSIGFATGIAGLYIVGLLLSAVNLMLAIFNMAPGFPLDGGRMLRAVIWRVTRNYLKATKYATRAGQAFGFLLIGFGLLQFVAVGVFGGLWLALIGFFVSKAADSAYQDALARVALEDVKVKDLMSPEKSAVPEHANVVNFLTKYVLSRKQSSAPAESQYGDSTGAAKAGVASDGAEDTPAKEVVNTDDAIVLHTNDPALKALQLMSQTRLDVYPVVDSRGKRVGTLSEPQLKTYLLAKNKLLAQGGHRS